MTYESGDAEITEADSDGLTRKQLQPLIDGYFFYPDTNYARRDNINN